jgi:hypothetical protein
MRKNVDISMYVGGQKASRIMPDEIDMADLPPIEKPSQQSSSSLDQTEPVQPIVETERISERFSARTEFRTENRSVLPVKRLTKRFSFEFYVDQLARLKRLKNHVEEKGETISLSDIVRQALDNYLKEHGE